MRKVKRNSSSQTVPAVREGNAPRPQKQRKRDRRMETLLVDVFIIGSVALTLATALAIEIKRFIQAWT